MHSAHILGFLVAIAVAGGIYMHQTGENPLEYFTNPEKSPLRHIDAAEEAADAYGSATDKRLEAEFGENWDDGWEK